MIEPDLTAPGPRPVLRVRADETTDGLWDADGQMMFSDDFPLLESTRERLARWCDWYGDFESFRPAYLRAPPVFPLEAFNAEGRAIADLIQVELPDWNIVYEKEPLDWSSTREVSD